MLYKPSNPSPYNSVVDYNTDNLAFSASCISTSDIGDMRLAIKDDSCEYYLPLTNSTLPTAQKIIEKCISSSGIHLPATDSTLDNALDFTNGYKITTNNYTRNPLGVTSMDGIIKPFTPYRWQLRLYETNCNTNIGYGFVTQAWKMSENSALKSACYSEEATHILKVRPHTNMFWNIQGDDAWRFNSFSNNTTKQQLTSFYDYSVRYQIEIGGSRYNVVAYYYSNSKNNNTNLTLQSDSYGQPLFAYMEIKADDNLSISEGDEYSIYTNYIDSNEYYFSCRQLSEVKFRGRDDSPIDEFTSIDELDKNPDDHIYSPTHSNVQIKGSFDSGSSAMINYYKATLYQVLSNGEDIQIHDSGYVYASEIDYDCKDLLSGNMYKLVISVTDTYGNTVSKGVYIKPNCGAIVKPTLLTVEPYREHNSIILDFGKLISITGVEADGYDGGYTIYDLDATWVDGLNYTSLELSAIGDAERIHSQACEIQSGNSITWSKYDGANKFMTCANPLVSMTFCCTGGKDNQTIFSIQNGEYTYELTWEVCQFHLWIGKTHTTYQHKTVTEIVDGYKVVSKTVLVPVTKKTTILNKYYNPYRHISMEDIHTAMASSDVNYTVPYLMYEDMTLEDSLYMHTESLSSDFWWHVIVADGYWYIKCLNAPSGLELINEETSTYSMSHNIEVATSVTLCGDCTYCNARIDEYAFSLLNDLKNNPLKDLVWGDSTVFQINFTGGLTAGNFDGGFQNGKYDTVDHFRIYKKYSNQPQLHLVFETDSATDTIIEDFSVGCKCPYTYYAVPVCKRTYYLSATETQTIETLGSIMESEPLELDDGVIRVLGLIQDPEDLDTYYIDMNNVWNFYLDINNAGFQNNMGKTYNDTPQKYPVEIKQKGFYRSFNINGLLGKYDCDKMEYVDSYDDIIEWENFVDNGEMKLVIDLRGIMTIGTMESNGVDYDEHGAEFVSANFSIKQLEDINKINIINRKLLLNPNDTTKQLLYEANGLALQDSADKYLIAKGGES